MADHAGIYITGAVDEELLLRVDSPPGRNPGIYRLVERSLLSALQKDLRTARLLRPRPYSRQAVTRYFVLCLRFRTCAPPSAHLLDMRCNGRLSRSACRSQGLFVHRSRRAPLCGGCGSAGLSQIAGSLRRVLLGNV